MFSHCLQPLTISLALYLSIDIFGFILLFEIPLEPTGLQP